MERLNLLNYVSEYKLISKEVQITLKACFAVEQITHILIIVIIVFCFVFINNLIGCTP